jgi:hypothetical protein
MNLKHLTDSALLKDTKVLAQKERELTIKVLHHLKEIEARKLYSDLKYSNLFEYCVKELGYSESSAMRRISAAKLLKEIPQIEQKIEQGTLTLSNISRASNFFKEFEINEPEIKKEILSQVENLSTRECDKKLSEIAHLDQNRRIRIEISEKTYNSLKNLRGIIGRDLSFDHLLDYMIEITSDRLRKSKYKQSQMVTTTSAPKETRVISAGVKRQVFLRDKKCVQCGTTHFLNYDHRKPFALGGKSTLENVRLLCFNCNQRSRIKAKL